MNKKFLFSAALISLFLVVVAVNAGTEVSPVITLKNPGYAKHTKGIVEFGHEKHIKEYKAACGECHHDDKGKPLDLKEGDDVQSCAECHKDFGKPPKAKKGKKKMSKKEKIKKYHKEAFHANCRDCHKKWNKEKGYKGKNPKAAPTTCKSCHPKISKKKK